MLTARDGRGLAAHGGRAEATANGAADAMQNATPHSDPIRSEKVCETIGLFNAEYLAMSDISITHTDLETVLNSTFCYELHSKNP